MLGRLCSIVGAVSILGTADARAQCPDPEVIELGSTVCDDLVASESDCFAFEALAGDVVWIRAIETASPQLELRLRLYGPDDELLATSSDNNVVSDILDLQLPASGTYTLEVLDAGRDDAGAYCLHALRTTGPGNATPVTFGPVQCGSISSAAEIDALGFEGSAGDVIWIRIVEMASPQLELRARLYGPDGSLVSAESGNNALVDLLDLELPATGAYTLLVYDDVSDDTGDYCLHLLRINDPSDAVPAEFGPVQCDAITSIAEVEAFTFEGLAGDVIWMRIVESASPQLELRTRLYGPDGSLVAAESGNNVLIDLLDFELPATGTYTLLVFDEVSDETGDYCFHLLRISDPSDAVPAEFGPVQCDAITSIADVEAFTFEGLAGDLIWIRIVESASPQLELRTRLYGPDGSLVAAESGNNALIDLLDFELPATGTYTLLVYDEVSDDTGDYCFHLLRINDPSDAVPAEFGPVQCDAITSIAEVEAFTFEGSAGDLIWIRIVESASPQLELRTRLYGPDGSLVAAESGNNVLIDLLDFELPATGTYTLLVFDEVSDDTGDYCFHLLRINDPSDAVPAEFGPVQCDAITSIAEVEAFTFEGLAGDVIWIRIVEASPQLELRTRLYGPDGSLVAAESGNNALIDLLDLELPATGTYTLLVYDEVSDDTGDYCFHLLRINDPSDAVPAEFGPVQCDAITSIAEVEAFTFEGVAGDVIWIRIVEASPQLELRTRLYGPDATLVTAQSGNNALVDLLDVQLRGTGTYTLLVFDEVSDETGEYCFDMQRITSPNDAPRLDRGSVTCGVFGSIAQLDAFTFAAGAGDSVRVRLVEDDALLEPALRVYGPDGTLLAMAAGNPVAQTLGIPIAEDGEHSIVVFDQAGDDAGGYRVEVEFCEVDPCPPFCPADSNGDGQIDVDDLVAVILRWGECACCDEDTTDYGAVTVDDLVAVILNWGPCF